jgi:hypothetical protein
MASCEGTARQSLLARECMARLVKTSKLEKARPRAKARQDKITPAARHGKATCQGKERPRGKAFQGLVTR